MRIPLLLLLLTALQFHSFAQRFDPLHPPSTYRNADNPLYWKNRPPYEGYWQQDVHYRITAKLNEEQDLADGTVTLIYWNNSPDTLREVFFHLYQNAYEAGSYLEKLEIAQGYGEAGDTASHRGTEVLSLKVGTVETEREVDNTIMRVRLPQPLAPNTKITFDYTFRTHWGGSYRRMKLLNAWGYKHFDGTHWYPRISVYDKQHGWDTYQHLGSEFYGDFGTYDVNLDMPNNMVVEATGWLQNQQEVLPPDLRAKLDLKNFANKPWGEKPSEVIPYDPAVRKVWKYHAENVHDFAFTADPTYRIGEAEWNGIKCIAMAEEPHASGWQNAADYCAKCIRSHSTNFGMYAYPKMVVADAADGMEYPMLTLDGDREPDYRGLFVHEIGHNWFFGMVGNNETYRALLDEGFTQFLTAFGLEDIDGDTMVADTPRTAYERNYQRPDLVRESEVYSGYMRNAVRGQVPPINAHSDEFGYYEKQGYGGYGHVYSKTSVMLYNLQYVLGDELFLSAMKHYFDQWKIAHPTVEDFRNSVIQFTHVDLNWFFDQWIDTDKRIDYSVGHVKHRNADGGQEIRFRREGDMQMPLDFTVTAKDGKSYNYHIPNGWFNKKTYATVLPRWVGYDELQRDYTARVNVPTGIADVRIDTTFRLADTYQLNNNLKFPFEAEFDHHLRTRADRKVYEGFVRPDVWWNAYDGMKLGIHFHSDWMRYKHKLWLTAWVNTGFAQQLREGSSTVGYDPISVNFKYENGTEKLLRGSGWEIGARVLDGLEKYSAGFTWKLPNDRTSLYARTRFLLRRDSTDLTYLNFPAEWELRSLNSTWDIGAKHDYKFVKGDGKMHFNMRNSGVGAAQAFAQVSLTSINENRLGRLKLHTRVFAQFGTGETPRESQLFLAGASPEEMMESKYDRSAGFVPFDQQGYGTAVNHYHMGGGLGLRGYAGYLAPELAADGTVILSYRGNTGGAINAELDVDGLIRLRPKPTRNWLHIDAYLFGDVGSMGYRQVTDQGTSQLRFAAPRADAGAGVAVTIKKFWKLVDIKPLTLRFDAPLFLSNIPAGETDHLAFRYVVGINRSF